MRCIKIVVQHQSVTLSLTILRGDNFISTPTFNTPEKDSPQFHDQWEATKAVGHKLRAGIAAPVPVPSAHEIEPKSTSDRQPMVMAHIETKQQSYCPGLVRHRPPPVPDPYCNIYGRWFRAVVSPTWFGLPMIICQLPKVPYPLLRTVQVPKLKCGRKEELETNRDKAKSYGLTANS